MKWLNNLSETIGTGDLVLVLAGTTMLALFLVSIGSGGNVEDIMAMVGAIGTMFVLIPVLTTISCFLYKKICIQPRN